MKWIRIRTGRLDKASPGGRKRKTRGSSGDSFDRVVAVAAAGDREARRVVTAVNAVAKVSTEALEAGIIEQGLDCLFKLYRYQTDQKYRAYVDSENTLPGILKVGKKVFGALAEAFGV